MNFFKSVFALLFLAAVLAFAQDGSKGTSTKVGIRGAIGYSTFWNADDPRINPPIDGLPDGILTEVTLAGLQDFGGMALDVGLGLQFPLASNLFLHVDAIASNRNVSSDLGIKIHVMGLTFDNQVGVADTTMDLAEITLDMWYLELPVLLRYQTASGLFFEAGPTLSFNMSADITLLFLNLNFDDYINGFTVGATLGVGKSFPAGSGVFEIDLRLSMGFTSLLKDRIDTNSGFSSDEIDLSAGEVGEIKVTDYWDPKDLLIRLGVSYWFM